jgi:hypothetical protein
MASLTAGVGDRLGGEHVAHRFDVADRGGDHRQDHGPAHRRPERESLVAEELVRGRGPADLGRVAHRPQEGEPGIGAEADAGGGHVHQAEDHRQGASKVTMPMPSNAKAGW